MEMEKLITDKIKKPLPSTKKANCSPLHFEYESSKEGIDSNLLILLHGLGDSEKPFLSLGKRLQGDLPQCAILSLRGCEPIPYMPPGTSWSYWNVFTNLGEEIANPNPTKFLQAFQNLIEYLTKSEEDGGCGWPSNSIHVFGYTHGATAAMEGVIAYMRNQTRKDELGSLVTICGELLSFPTFTPPLEIPVLAFTRNETSKNDNSTIKSIQKAFKNVQQINFPPSSATINQQPQMPKNEHEWRSIMVFWSKLWRNRTKWEIEGELYTFNPNSNSKSSSSISKVENLGWSPTAEEKLK